jgi:hypothetical protein
VAHRPSVPQGKQHANRVSPRVSSPSGLQAVTARHCPGHNSAIRVSAGSVPRVAYRPSVPHAGAVCCPASRAYFAADDQVCSENLKSELVRSRFVLTSESLLTIPTWAERNSANISRVAARY